ncbi:hypothetical protein QE152_g15331 [Popillia japonica]|uniref:Uncharacterized protein n=1 Tax=Popillia japonica TaxID=7064 RepID=A0AAW1L9B4_POPJA
MLLSVLMQYLILLADGFNKTNSDNEIMSSSKSSALSQSVTNKSEHMKINVKNDSSSVKKKLQVKLNSRQGLIMNQILSIYALDHVENELCLNHSLELKDALRSFEPWALKSK